MDNFDKIFKQYWPYVCAIARNRRAHDIEAIASSVFLQLSKQENFESEPALRSWLSKATVYRCIDQSRARERSAAHANKYTAEVYGKEEPTTVSREKELEQLEIKAELSAIIWKEINKLPPKARRTFCLYYFDDVPTKKIAKIMNVNESTVWNNLAYARKVLRLNIVFKK